MDRALCWFWYVLSVNFYLWYKINELKRKIKILLRYYYPFNCKLVKIGFFNNVLYWRVHSLKIQKKFQYICFAFNIHGIFVIFIKISYEVNDDFFNYLSSKIKIPLIAWKTALWIVAINFHLWPVVHSWISLQSQPECVMVHKTSGKYSKRRNGHNIQ